MDEITTATAGKGPLGLFEQDGGTDGKLNIRGAIVSAPASSEKSITLTLPGDARSSTRTKGLTLDLTGGGGYSTAVQDAGKGSFRALLHIVNESAPREYRFDLGKNVRLHLRDDGSVAARDIKGELLGTFQAAWARDATGARVPTRYRVEGSVLVQSLSLKSSTKYPVVADPFWIPALFVVARISAHAASRAAARGVSQALIKQVVQNGVRTAGKKGTSVFSQGSGKKRIRVVVDNKTGNIITVTKG